MITVTDDFMKERLSHAKNYCLVILKEGQKKHEPGAREIIWEHARNNFALREAGILSIVCPVTDDSTTCGVGIFNADPVAVKTIMEEDPAVQAGVLVYEIHTCKSFPGDSLPK